MRRFGPRRLWMAGLLAVGVPIVVIAIVLLRGEDLRTRLSRVSLGMTRAEVEAVLGRPEVTLPIGRNGGGEVLLWVDILWQVEVRLGPDGRVTKTDWTRSQSIYWNTVGRLISAP